MPLKISAFLTLYLLLAACGYQLRGSIALPVGMENVYLEGASEKLRTEMSQALRFSKGRLVNSPQEAGIVIKIEKETLRTRVLSVSSTGKANQFEILYTLVFDFYDPSDRLLLANQRVQSQRSYFNDQEEVLAQTNEEQLIRNEMYGQAVRSIVIRARIAMKNNQKKPPIKQKKL
jgi:LPS-assembly lipoprotein